MLARTGCLVLALCAIGCSKEIAADKVVTVSRLQSFGLHVLTDSKFIVFGDAAPDPDLETEELIVFLNSKLECTKRVSDEAVTLCAVDGKTGQIAASNGRNITVWSSAGKKLGLYPTSTEISSIAFLSNQDLLFGTTRSQESVRILRRRDDKEIESYSRAKSIYPLLRSQEASDVDRIAAIPGREVVAVAFRDSCVFYDLTRRREIHQISADGPIGALRATSTFTAFTANGKLSLVDHKSYKVRKIGRKIRGDLLALGRDRSIAVVGTNVRGRANEIQVVDLQRGMVVGRKSIPAGRGGWLVGLGLLSNDTQVVYATRNGAVGTFAIRKED